VFHLRYWKSLHKIAQIIKICHVIRLLRRPCKYFQVVFRGGEGALQVLPPLIDVIPEARLNLVIYYLRQGIPVAACTTVKRNQEIGYSFRQLLCQQLVKTKTSVSSVPYCFIFFFPITDDLIEAYTLIKDHDPTTPQEYIIKAVVNAALGQDQGSVSCGTVRKTERLFYDEQLDESVTIRFSQPPLHIPDYYRLVRPPSSKPR